MLMAVGMALAVNSCVPTARCEVLVLSLGGV